MLTLADISDRTVVAGVAGSQTERNLLSEVLVPHVRGMVIARLAPTPAQFHAVDEIVQQVMVGLMTGLERLEQPTVQGLKAFVSGIVRNQVSLFLAGRGAAAPAVPCNLLDTGMMGCSQVSPLWDILSSDGTSPLSAVARADQCSRVIDELGRLKPEHRDVITLAFFDQLPTGDVARIMGISRPAASMLLIRAIKSLRRSLTGSSELGTADALAN